MSHYLVKRINIFTKPIFTSTTYSICAFSFYKQDNYEQFIECFNVEKNEKYEMRLQAEYGYRYGGEYLSTIEKQNSLFTRLLAEKEPQGFITQMKLYGLDTRERAIHIEIEKEPYYGKTLIEYMRLSYLKKN